METRKFTVVDTRTNCVKEFDSQATTLSELKNDLSALGISTEGMTIQEGLTKIELVDDSAILPHDVLYKGVVTNNLVFRITASQKRIKSGSSRSREEAYAFIQSHNLQKEFLYRQGKPYTNCSTGTLNAVIDSYIGDTEEIDLESLNEYLNDIVDRCDKLATATAKLVSILANNYTIDTKDAQSISDLISGIVPKNTKSSRYSPEEIAEMFVNM